MKGWHVLITGGSSGIGLGIAQALSQRGATLHLSARGEAKLAEAAATIDGPVFTYASDTTDGEARRQLMDAVAANAESRLDGLVVNAATYAYTPLLQEDDASIDNYFRTNTLPAFSLVKLAYPLLKAGEGKSVLFVSSNLAARPIAGVGAYAASKAAMNSLAQSWALELAPDRIRVNAVLPGVVDTPIHDPKEPGDPSREEKLGQLGPAHPMGRVGTPQDVAGAACYLMAPEAGWVTGSLLFVDGGIGLV